MGSLELGSTWFVGKGAGVFGKQGAGRYEMMGEEPGRGSVLESPVVRPSNVM